MSFDHRALFCSAPVAMLVLDPELVIVEVNDDYLSATMRERADLIGQSVFAAFPENPADPGAGSVAQLASSLDRVRRDGVADILPIQQYDIPQPGGGFQIRFWSAVNAPVFAADGTVSLIIHRVTDVTEYMLAKEGHALRVLTGELESEIFARRQAQERITMMQAVADSLVVAIIAGDPTGRPAMCNQAALGLVGDLVRGRALEQWPEPLRPLLARVLHGEVVREAEVELRLPGRPRQILRMNARPLTGQPSLAVVVGLRDVTARRLASRLQEGELEITHLIANGQPSTGTLRRVMAIAGASIGWQATEFWAVDEVTRTLRREAHWGESARSGPDLPAQTLRGAGPRWEDGALAVPVPAGAEPLGVLVCYAGDDDVPEELRAAVVTGIGARLGEWLQRRRAERLAAELARTRDEYIALVGHELRTPLTSIQAHTELLLDDPGLSDDQRDALGVMRRNTESLRTIVLRLLDVAGLRWGHIELHRKPVDLAVLVREAAAGHSGVAIGAVDPLIVDGDRGRLGEVLDELIGNARDWAAEGTVVTVGVHADGGAAAVTVTNRGTPIAAHERGRLFDLFFRGDAARHGGMRGNGLGLTVARAIVEQHGGTLTVGEPDGGMTTFTVRLPLTA
ncbi:histidine kinase [Actinoplanes sp. SE50]|uniref:sensor histidine kinase n=1 Tax=unclassified Actinoplanes TaxID=2626549 RepID=UPI00023EBF52|nr:MULTISPECIES: PAS domain-containing sensor histidine kinase [unclassified Actinoplanes]AEV85743.1 Phytochrome B [Actinoplanes sp. SE50/110]ATO84136.1 histidine kinase [Actinoplanes sp. SE50]SLM01546.1 multi-sensor signal transduction histidine kinase [Actinoplanes sp. SE50/110]